MKCPICGQSKGKRRCKRHGMAEICALCCAGRRDADCAGCTFLTAAHRYDGQRRRAGALSGRHFIAELNPEVEQAVNNAMELAEHGQKEQAVSEVERLLRDHPRNHTVCYAMGTLCGMQGRSDEAIQWFDKAIEIFPYFVEAHFNRAVACQQKLDIAGAVRAYRNVMEVSDPREDEYQRARSFVDGMAESIRRTEGIDLDAYLEAQDAFNQAYALMEAGDWARALAGFRAAATKNDRNAPTHGNIGLCLAQLGRKAEALAELDRAVALDADYEPAITNRLVVERMEEGQPLGPVSLLRVEFSKERMERERSLNDSDAR